MVVLDRFVALDVEIAARRPLAVCAIGAARFEAGTETRSYESRVQYTGRVKYSAIHGLTRTELRDAPAWGAVWRDLSPLLQDIRYVVAYRASFDRAAILTMCARHRIRLPHIQFVCAAQMYHEVIGRHAMDLAATLAALGIAFPGQPHDALADARAAAALTLRLAQLKHRKGGGVIQLSENAAGDDPATHRPTQ